MNYRPRKHLSPSSMSCASRCLRRFFYQYGLGLRAPGRSTLYLTYGEAIHCGLAACYENDVDKAMEGFMRVWGDLEGDEKRNPKRAYKVFEEFARRIQGAPYRLVDPPEGVPVVNSISDKELPFSIDIGLEIPVVGRIDAIGEHLQTKELWAIEFKTTSELSTRFLSGFSLMPSFITYALALSMYENKKVGGTFLEALRTSAVNAESLSFPIYFEEQAYEDLLAWYGEQYRKIKACEELDYWPKNLAACNSYAQFGEPGYTCEYQSLCLQADWKSALGLYEIEEERPFLLSEKDNDSSET